MSDHLKNKRRSPPAGEVGVRDLKTHAARILRQVREARASYILTHRGRAVAVILPLDPAEHGALAREAGESVQAWDAFLRAGRRIAQRFRPGVSGVRLLTTMRR